jgi:hypothetical protein
VSFPLLFRRFSPLATHVTHDHSPSFPPGERQSTEQAEAIGARRLGCWLALAATAWLTIAAAVIMLTRMA